MKRIILAVGIMSIMLSIGGCVASVEIPPDPKIALVEYSVDGEIWHSLRKDEVKRVDASVIKVRRTEVGSALPFGAIADLRNPGFSGTLTKDSDSQVIVAEGKGGFLIRVGRFPLCEDYHGVIMFSPSRWGRMKAFLSLVNSSIPGGSIF